MKLLTLEQKKRGFQAVTLLLGVLKGTISKEDASLILNGRKRKCRPGAGGICQTHGQLMKECHG